MDEVLVRRSDMYTTSVISNGCSSHFTFLSLRLSRLDVYLRHGDILYSAVCILLDMEFLCTAAFISTCASVATQEMATPYI